MIIIDRHYFPDRQRNNGLIKIGTYTHGHKLHGFSLNLWLIRYIVCMTWTGFFLSLFAWHWYDCCQ